VIVGGKLRGVGTPGEIVGMESKGMEILFELPGGAAKESLLRRATQTGDRYRIQLQDQELFSVMEELRAAQAKILAVSQVKPSLEEYFMHLVEADRAQASAVEVYGK
jgi:ABC-type multidrug transport system ATPase subunit